MPEHLDRALAAMADAGIDALILGRAGNARFVSNAEVLSLTGTRPFAPGCVVVRTTGKVHLLSITPNKSGLSCVRRTIIAACAVDLRFL